MRHCAYPSQSREYFDQSTGTTEYKVLSRAYKDLSPYLSPIYVCSTDPAITQLKLQSNGLPEVVSFRSPLPLYIESLGGIEQSQEIGDAQFVTRQKACNLRKKKTAHRDIHLLLAPTLPNETTLNKCWSSGNRLRMKSNIPGPTRPRMS